MAKNEELSRLRAELAEAKAIVQKAWDDIGALNQQLAAAVAALAPAEQQPACGECERCTKCGAIACTCGFYNQDGTLNADGIAELRPEDAP